MLPLPSLLSFGAVAAPSVTAVARRALPIALALALGGCATYTDRLRNASLATTAGNYEHAVAEIDDVLGVGSSDELPARLGADKALTVLERGVLQQSLRRHRASARDISAAEKEIEVIELSTDPVGTIGRYVYSDTAQPYRALATERLALNPLNLLNYLALGDLDGAAVEARRFQVMREYLEGEGRKLGSEAVLGTYLAGFVFEHRGERDRALRYYEETLERCRLENLTTPVQRLSAAGSYRGPRLSELLERAPPRREAAGGEVLVVVSAGRVPHKEPERVPVGVAFGIAGTYVTGDIDWLKYSAGKVVVYPELKETPSVLGPPQVHLDGHPIELEELVDLGFLVRGEYEKMKPMIVAAALSRVASRAAVAEGVRAAGKQESQLLGDVLSILAEGAMVALDRPDTRSWTTLPERVFVARVPAEPGAHIVDVSFGGAASRRVDVTVGAGGYGVAVVTEPR